MSTALHKDAAVIEHGSALLAGMKDVCPSLVYAALLTDDGFEVVRLARTDRDGGRFASMASSMQALSDAVARELHIGSSEYTIIASASGHVVQLRVPGHALVLSSLFDNDETLGKALAISRQTAERMAAFSPPTREAPDAQTSSHNTTHRHPSNGGTSHVQHQ